MYLVDGASSVLKMYFQYQYLLLNYQFLLKDNITKIVEKTTQKHQIAK